MHKLGVLNKPTLGLHDLFHKANLDDTDASELFEQNNHLYTTYGVAVIYHIHVF